MTARDFFVYATGIFWLGVGYVAVKCPNSPAPAATCEAPKLAATKKVTLAELALHNQPTDCWMAFEGRVYAVHGFIDIHPSASGVMEPYCGKEATTAYSIIDRGKQKGQPHSARAGDMLTEYLFGELSRD